MGLPALLLDEDGTVVEANNLIEGLCDHVQWRARNRISLTDERANELLWSCLAALDTHPEPAIRSFPLRDEDDRAAFVVHIIPIRRSAHDIFAGSYVLLVVTPVTAPQAPPVELMRSLFDLTPAEARVARGLAMGEALDEIAASGDVAISTVRSQMRQILEKTGCVRQAEVVALMASVTLDRGAAKKPVKP